MATDLALLKIDPPFIENKRIKPIRINDELRNLKGKVVLISGWGKTTTVDSPVQLRKAAMKITRNGVDYRGGKTIEMMSFNGIGACFGDSGGKHVSLYYF